LGTTSYCGCLAKGRALVGNEEQSKSVAAEAASGRQIVDLMAEYVSQGEGGFEAEHGARALEVAQEMMAALLEQLEGNLGHVVLLEQFLRTPGIVSEALVGVIQELLRRDAVFAGWVDEALSRYRACASE
jgi:hypothetical protein